MLQRNPNSVSLLGLAAQAAYVLKRYAEAEGFLERALERQPDSAALRNALARTRSRKQREE